MTKTELQSALAEPTHTDKRTAGVFLDTLSALAYKEIKKNGEFVLPGFGKLVKQKRKARTGFNPKTQQKIKGDLLQIGARFTPPACCTIYRTGPCRSLREHRTHLLRSSGPTPHRPRPAGR